MSKPTPERARIEHYALPSVVTIQTPRARGYHPGAVVESIPGPAGYGPAVVDLSSVPAELRSKAMLALRRMCRWCTAA